MDTAQTDHQEQWEAKRREYDAKAQRLDAESRLEYNDAFENFSEEVSAAGAWSEAAFKEFLAKVDGKWQEFAMNMKE